MFIPGFTSPILLKSSPFFVLRDCHPLRSAFPDGSHISWFIRFRSPLLTESRLLSFPVATEMFQFTTFALCTYAFSAK